MLKIKKELYDNIVLYCKANKIDDVDKFCSDLLEKSFTVEKYGAQPDIIIKPKISEIVPEEIKVPEEKLVYNPTPKKETPKRDYDNDDYKVYDNI